MQVCHHLRKFSIVRRHHGLELVQGKSLEETRLLRTDAKLRAMSLLNGRGAKEEDKVNPT